MFILRNQNCKVPAMKENKGNRKYLIFLTSTFPYGSGETFIENESPFLAGAFEKVFLLVPNAALSQTQRPVPENVILMPIQQGLLWPLRVKALFWPTFWQGFSMDLKRKNRKAGLNKAFRNCLHYYTLGLQVKKTINNVIEKFKLPTEETIFYSYWMDEKALGISLVKKNHPEIIAVSRAHGWDVFEERHQPPYLPFRPWLLKTLDKVAVVSKKGAVYISEKFEPPKGKVEVSYLGTDKLNVKRAPRLGSGQENNPSISLGARNEKYSIVSCSSIIPLKRIELIIEALSLLNFPVSWTHFGDGPLRNELGKKAARFFEGKNIDYRFTGQISNKQVREFYETQHVDLFISTSETEGLPVSMMEAQSAGIPILATDVGGVNEIVIDDVTGWLLPANPDSAFVAGKITEIHDLLDAEKQKVRENAIKHWQNNFNAEQNYATFVNLLQNL